MHSADYAAWVHRAKTFVRGLANLPGAVQVCDAIEPAATDKESLEWLTSDKCSLPAEIRDFLLSASKRCCFHFEWRPTADGRERLCAFQPGLELLSGGANLCEASGYSNYDHRDWFREFLGNQSPVWQMLAAAGAAEDRGDLLTLTRLGNDDQLAIEIGPGHEERGVVYVFATGGRTRQKVSASFGQFLIDWERICYLTPSYETLSHWMDSTGMLRPDERKAERLRTLFNCSALNTDENPG